MVPACFLLVKMRALGYFTICFNSPGRSWPGGGLLLAAYLLFLFKLVRLWRRRRDQHAVGVGAGVIAGLLSVGIHSFFDFSLRIPANPVALAGGAGVLSVRHLQAEIQSPTQYNSTLNLNYTPYLADIEAAIDRFPWNPECHLKRARFYSRAATPNDDLRRQYNREAVESLETALRLNPAQPYAWRLLGRQYARRDADPARYLAHWLPLADRCMDMSVTYAPREEAVLARAAVYWAWRAAVLPEDGGQRAEDSKLLTPHSSLLPPPRLTPHSPPSGPKISILVPAVSGPGAGAVGVGGGAGARVPSGPGDFDGAGAGGG